ENVPVYSCAECCASEVHEQIKTDLTRLLDCLGDKPDEQMLYFDEYNELAYLLKSAADRDSWTVPLDQLLEERVNQLLDLMLLARSLEDDAWRDDIRRRLTQIANYSLYIA